MACRIRFLSATALELVETEKRESNTNVKVRLPTAKRRLIKMPEWASVHPAHPGPDGRKQLSWAVRAPEKPIAEIKL